VKVIGINDQSLKVITDSGIEGFINFRDVRDEETTGNDLKMLFKLNLVLQVRVREIKDRMDKESNISNLIVPYTNCQITFTSKMSDINSGRLVYERNENRLDRCFDHSTDD